MAKAEQLSKQPDPEQQAEQQQQKQLRVVSQTEAVKSQVLENQKKEAEVEGQQIENVVQLATGGTEQGGFVQ